MQAMVSGYRVRKPFTEKPFAQTARWMFFAEKGVGDSLRHAISSRVLQSTWLRAAITSAWWARGAKPIATMDC